MNLTIYSHKSEGNLGFKCVKFKRKDSNGKLIMIKNRKSFKKIESERNLSKKLGLSEIGLPWLRKSMPYDR